MLNRIKLALRHLWRDRAYAGINIFGLSVGLAASLAIFLYSGFHFSFDRFHEGADRMFRVLTIDRALGVSSSVVGITTPAAGPSAYQQIPEVEAQVRFVPQGQNLLKVGERSLFSEEFAFVDSNFFEFFNFPLLTGDASTVLREPNKVLLSRSLAEKMFPDEDPVGQQIQAAHTQEPVMVEGIFEDLPQNSHFEFDMAVSIIPEPADSGTAQFLESWGTIAAPTYIRLNDASKRNAVLERLIEIGKENDYGADDNFSLTMQPMLEAHLHSTELLFDDHNSGKTDIGQIRNLFFVAIFLLLIASFNFMNLSTARSGKRAREIGMRKVLGATRLQLILQFLLESLVLVILAFVLGLAILELFGNTIGINVPEGFITFFLSKPNAWLISALTVILLGIVSGLYPAMVLSGFQPVHTLKGEQSSKTATGSFIRRVLVTLQFTVSVVVIIGMIVVRKQVAFMNQKDMGFEKDHVVTIPMNSREAVQRATTLKEELLKLEEIEGAAYANSLPGSGYGRLGLSPEGYSGEENWIFSVTAAGLGFDEVLGLDLIEGRFFDREHPTDMQTGLVINKAAAEALGWDEAVGRTIQTAGAERTVIGVIANFHYVGLRYPIEPLMLLPLTRDRGVLSLRIENGKEKEALAKIEDIWKEIVPSDPFEYSYFDEDFNQLFTDDEQFSKVLSSFNWLAILIACLGLLGLTAYTVQQKTKELAVRKVLGAGIIDLLSILSKEFWWLLLISNAMAIPIAWYYMREWINDFVYRIDLGIAPFATGILASFAVAIFTILTQALRAYRIRTINALKNE